MDKDVIVRMIQAILSNVEKVTSFLWAIIIYACFILSPVKSLYQFTYAIPVSTIIHKSISHPVRGCK